MAQHHSCIQFHVGGFCGIILCAVLYVCLGCDKLSHKLSHYIVGLHKLRASFFSVHLASVWGVLYLGLMQFWSEQSALVVM